MRILIKNGWMIDPSVSLCEVGNLYLENEKIICVESASYISGNKPNWQPDDVKVVDAQGKWVAPGFIDLHVHFRDPGFEYKEDIYSGCRAAAKGGYTTVCCMPNTKPIVDHPQVVEYIDEKAKKANGVHVLAIGSITKEQQGKELADIQGMAQADTVCKKMTGKGICAISEDGRSVMNSKMMLDGMIEGQKNGLIVYSHTEDESLAGTSIGEELIVARDLMLAQEAGVAIHLCHISTAKSLEMIREAKSKGIKVTAETGPHYFVFDKNDVGDDGNKKMNPPLRNPKDVEAVKAALKDGTLDIIATDHAPHSKEEKERGYEKALNGVVGLETAFAISYTKLVKEGILTPLDLIDKMSTQPAKILGCQRGSLVAGKNADLVVLDVENEYEIKSEDFVSKGKNSPFIGMKVFGKVVTTIADGQIIYTSM